MFGLATTDSHTEKEISEKHTTFHSKSKRDLQTSR